MHELSLAIAILDLARRHVPAGSFLTRASVRAGPMRAIDPEAMSFAWHSALAAANLPDADLRLEITPWNLRCPTCHGTYSTHDLDDLCHHCARPGGIPVDSDDLQLTSIEVDTQPRKGVCP